jgi:AraC-like DNA-binding protein
MENEKEKIIAILNSALASEISDCLLVFENDGGISTHSIPRIIINWRGLARGTYYHHGEFNTIDIPTGVWCYCSDAGYLKHEAKYANESISVSFYGSYIRAMHITYDGEHPSPHQGDLFHHAGIDLPVVGQKLIVLLDELAAAVNYKSVAPYLLKALLKVAIEAISLSSNTLVHFNTNNMWIMISNYMHKHYAEVITRNSIAKYFNISPGYISHLSRQFTHHKFNENLLLIRLKHAKSMLNDTQFSVNEIADECGFSCASYFIKRFKSYYGVTPNNYRKNNLNRKLILNKIGRTR